MPEAPLLPARPAARRTAGADFLRFGVVGAGGFVVDTAIVYATRGTIGLYAGGLLAWFVAATVNWALNRAWTFRGRGTLPPHRQWAAFLAANLAGLVLNRGTYAGLVTFSGLCARQPVLAILGGVAAGLGANFLLSRRYVFR
jgi:putative flippase GtrA